MIVYPNAKINIGLNIIKKRPDYYHEISSFFYPVKSLFDVLEIIPNDTFSFSSSGIFIPGNENICVRAYELLRRDFNIDSVKIHLHKLIPIGLGLGGGSSDGAFTLIVLNKLFKLKLSIDQLEAYALKLGADCPFFIENRSKYVTGIGEHMVLSDLDLSDYNLKFIFSKFHISSSDAYSDITPHIPSDSLLDLVKYPIAEWRGRVRNDFEYSVFKKYPELQKAKDNFYSEGALYASMSGSGSAIYGIFEK